jgi:hypothetical protein
MVLWSTVATLRFRASSQEESSRKNDKERWCFDDGSEALVCLGGEGLAVAILLSAFAFRTPTRGDVTLGGTGKHNRKRSGSTARRLDHDF